MCNKRIVSGENSQLYSISSFSSRRRLIIKMKISDNFKLMHITATQIIAHYSVNFDPIQKSFKELSLNFRAMVGFWTGRMPATGWGVPGFLRLILCGMPC